MTYRNEYMADNEEGGGPQTFRSIISTCTFVKTAQITFKPSKVERLTFPSSLLPIFPPSRQSNIFSLVFRY